MKAVFRSKSFTYFAVFTAIFLIHQFTQKMGWHWRLADNYLDPFLAVPVMLGGALILLRLIDQRAVFYPLTIAIYTIGLIVVFESGWIEDERLHSDIWDVVGYVVGAFVFDRTINQRKSAA